MKTKSFESFNFDQFTQDINEAFSKIGQKYGLAITKEGGRYTPTTYHFKCTAVITDGLSSGNDDINILKFKSELKSKGKLYFDINESEFNKIIDSRGEKFRFVGLKTSKRRYPFVFENLSDKSLICFTADTAKYLLKQSTKFFGS